MYRSTHEGDPLTFQAVFPRFAPTVAAFLACGIAFLCSLPAGAQDPFVEFAKAKNAFDAGDYPEACRRFEAFLSTASDNPALIAETHKYLGVSYLFLNEKEKAEEQFVQLLNMEPEFMLDPLIFPIDVVDFFTEVQQKHAQRLARIAEAEARAEAEKKAQEEKERQLAIEKLRTHVYLERHVKEHSLLVALMPFGAGQFQNGQRRKGVLFLTGELTLMSAGIVTFALHESLRKEAETPFYSAKTKKKYERLETGYRIANHASLISVGVLMLAGIVDSIYFFSQRDTTWRKLEEKDVPPRYQPHRISLRPMVAPMVLPNGGGLSAAASF